MNKRIKNNPLSYIVVILIVAIAIFTVIRICTNTTKNVAFGISGQADGNIQMADSYCLEVELDAPTAGLTGLSFRFSGKRENFGDSAFLVTVTMQNDSSDPKILYENRVALIEQVYDYASYNHIVIVPFEGYVEQGDHLCITILGIGMSAEDNISVHISSQTSKRAAANGAVFEINNVRQNSMLAATLYYQISKLNIFPTIMQGIVCVLLVLLIGELLPKMQVNDKSKKAVNDIRISFGKRIIKILPIVIMVAVALEYTYYAGIKMQIQDYDLSPKLKLFFVVFSGLVIGFTFIVFLYGQKKVGLEKFLFLTIVCLGILFEIAITPFAVPDESSHIDTVYRISNEIMRIEDTGIRDAIYKRECDIYTDIDAKIKMSREDYQWISNDWFNTEGSKKLVYAADNRRLANSLFYLPAAVGMTIGRILGVGFPPMVYLARTANLLFAALMIYLAVKKIPYGKSILCMIALLPITLQEIASCSYDALIIPISMLYVSYCVFAIHSKEKLERIDVLVILITVVMLGICKGRVYTTLYFLGLWVLVKRGYIRLPQKKVTRMVGIALVFIMVLVGIIGVMHIYRQPVDVNSLMEGGNYSLAYLFQHPWITLRIIENSIYKNTYYHLEQLFGKGMGSLQISVKFIVPIGYMILLERAVICSENSYIPNVLDKCVFMMTAIAVIAAILTAFLTVTSFGDNSIWGVQGRYFLPMAWLFLICFRRTNVVYKNKNYTGLILMGYLLGVCTVLQIVISAFNPMI